MRRSLSLLRLLWRADQRGVALSVLAATAAAWSSIGLLAVSGYFITATAMAGLLALGFAFDVFRPSAVIRFLAIARTATRYGERLASHDTTLRFLADLRLRVFKRWTQGEPLAAMQRWRSAERLSRMTTDVDALDGLFVRFALPAAVSGLTVIVLAAVVAGLIGKATLAVSMAIIAIAIGLLLAVARRSRPAAAFAVRAVDAMRIRMIDLAAARLDLETLGQRDNQARRIEAAADRLDAAEDRLNRTEALGQAGLGIIAVLPVIAVLAAGPALIEGEMLGAAIFVGLALATLIVFETFPVLVNGIAHLGRSTLAARRLDIDNEEEAGQDAAAGTSSPSASPSLVFKGTTLRYGPERRPALDHIDLAIAPGERVALVGASGSGKSSLLTLAARLRAPTGGAILLGGEPLVQWNELPLRRTVGYLPQRVDLFAGTLAENVTLGAVEADDEAICAACEAAGLFPLIEELPGGIHALMGEGGCPLSGGERRRVGLARLFLRRPSLWLLDEPTESLDSDSAGIVLSSLSHHANTLIVACHLRREAEVADRIVTLAGGRIVGNVHRSDEQGFLASLGALRATA